MGMEVCLYRLSKKEDIITKDTEWYELDNKMIWYGCGYGSLGVDIFSEYVDKDPDRPDEGVLHKSRIPEIIQMCRGIVTGQRLAVGIGLQFPVEKIRALLDEAEKNEDGLVTIPVDDLEIDDTAVDSKEWNDAKRLLDALEEVSKTWNDDTYLFMYLSY